MPAAESKKFAYRLLDTTDPEERLEDAALWKAMKDVYGDQLYSISKDMKSFPADYGRGQRWDPNGRTSDIPYWDDPIFLQYARRDFHVMDLDGAEKRVRMLHGAGYSAFVKSLKAKHMALRVPRGRKLLDVMDGMEYSFCNGERMMVQEFVPMRGEHRFFVIDRKIVTESPNAVHLTPLDFEENVSCMWQFKSPLSKRFTQMPYYERGALLAVAKDIAKKMRTPDGVIDLAFKQEYDDVLCVEINPLVVGGVGLFACDVRALAKAIYKRDNKQS